MKRYKSNAILRDQAKEKLTGKYGNAIFALILVSAVTGTISGTVTSFIPAGGWFGNIVSILLTAVVSIFLGVMQTGIAYYFLNVACDMKHASWDVFYGFQENAGRSIQVSLVHVVLETVCTLPFQILMHVFINSFNYKYLLFAYAAMFIGYAVMTPFSLAISQSYYLLLDFPDSTARDVIETSIRIMKGHKWRLFKLELSFLPLHILCMLSLGIGYLWLNPYMRMTYTLFFLDLMNPETEQKNEYYSGFENMGQAH